MSSYGKANVAVRNAGPTDYADFLLYCLNRRFPTIELTIVCESSGSAGQTRRRLTEKMEQKGGSLSVFAVREHASSLEISFPEAPEEESIEEEDYEARERPVGVTNGSADKEIPEGVFKVKLASFEPEKKPDKHYARIRCLIEAGPLAGRSFDDKVLVWPVGPRTRYFAEAVKVAPEDLPSKRGQVLGVKVWVRRVAGVREDGSTIWLNNYYPPEWSPPPSW